MLQPDPDLSIGIVDPDPSSRTAVARLLLAHGYQSQSFASCQAYGANLEAAAPATLLLIDVRAFLAVRPAQRKHLFAGSAVIALGNEVRLEDIGRSLEAGCADFLVKPVPSVLLLHVMAKAMRGMRAGLA